MGPGPLLLPERRTSRACLTPRHADRVAHEAVTGRAARVTHAASAHAPRQPPCASRRGNRRACIRALHGVRLADEHGPKADTRMTNASHDPADRADDARARFLARRLPRRWAQIRANHTSPYLAAYSVRRVVAYQSSNEENR